MMDLLSPGGSSGSAAHSESAVSRQFWLRLATGRVARLFLPTLILGLAWLWTFSGLFFDDKPRLLRYDLRRYFGPNAFYLDYNLHRGTIPLWNPLTFCGTPFAANPQACVFYPPNLVRSALDIDPTPDKAMFGLIFLSGFHLVIGAVGLFVLARSYRLSLISSSVAAIFFTLNALVIRRLPESHYVSALCWLPFILLYLQKALGSGRRRDKIGYSLVSGGFLALTLLSGFLQIVPYIVLVPIALAAMHVLVVVAQCRLNRLRSGLTAARSAIGVLLLVFVTGGALASAILIPATEFTSRSSRAAEPDRIVESYTPHLTPLYILRAMTIYPGERFEAETVRGAGIAFLLLLGASVFRWTSLVWSYWVVALVLIDCTIGPPLPVASFLERVVPFEMVSTSRAFDVALMPLSILAGFGFDALSKPMGAARLSGLRVFLFVIAIVGIGALVGALASGLYVAVSGAVLIYPLVFAIVTIFAPVSARGVVWKGILTLLIICEVSTWARSYFDELTLAASEAQRPSRDSTFTEFWPGKSRGLERVPNLNLYRLAPAINGYDPVYIAAVRDMLSGRRRGQHYRRTVDSAEMGEDNLRTHLYFKRRFWLARQYATGTVPGKDELFVPTAVAFLDAGQPVHLPRIEYTPAGTSISSNSSILYEAKPTNSSFKRDANGAMIRTVEIPEFHLTGQHAALRVTYSSNCQGTMRARFVDSRTGHGEWGFKFLTDMAQFSGAAIEFPLPDFEAMQIQLYLERKNTGGEFRIDHVQVVQDNDDETNLIQVTSSSPNDVALTVGELSGARILTFLDADYPGWRAYVDGKEVSVLRTFKAFKGVYLPAGRHEVVFRFRSIAVRLGIAVSVGSLAVCMAYLIVFGLFRLRIRNGHLAADPGPSSKSLDCIKEIRP